MSSPKKNTVNPKDLRQQKIDSLIERNPCPLCRSRKMPLCLCRGGSGGGGGSDSSEKDASQSDNAQLSGNYRSLTSLFLNSDIWKESPEHDLVYKLAPPFGLFSIAIDVGGLKLTFEGSKSLNYEDRQKFDAFYARIKAEFNSFKQALLDLGIKTDANMSHKGDTLIITIPDSNQFGVFIERLMNVGLLPKHASQLASIQKMIDNHPDTSHPSSYKTPNPFDISKGPRPSKDTGS